MKKFNAVPRPVTFALALAFGMSSAQAAVDISATPLQTGSTVAPNLLFILDDSGSMRFGFMPDELDEHFNLTQCYSYGSYAGQNMCYYSTNDDNRPRAFLASYAKNKLYFNPTADYEPPPKGDGSYFPPADFYNAKVNGYAASSSTVNLASRYRAIVEPYYYVGGGYGFTVSKDGNREAAFYYTFNGNSGCGTAESNDDASFENQCYTKHVVSAAEQQKFANWFSYYRTREMAAKAGLGTGFNILDSEIRLGYGAINLNPVIQQGVAPFSSSARTGFFNWLYSRNSSGSTPLLGALDKAGRYYKTAAPWITSAGDPTELSCRQSFTILMTDGYYGDSISVGNQDGTDGDVHTSPKGDSLKYLATNPYMDSNSNTLADVAMKYWKEDLRPFVDNNVPVSAVDPAFWQHMSTIGVSFGVRGTVDETAALSNITNTSYAPGWPAPGSSDSAKIDDLLHAAINGRGSYISAADGSTFATKFTELLGGLKQRTASASNLGGTTTSLETESTVFQGRFTSGDWTGDVHSYDLDGNLNWKASEKVPAADARNIVFYKDASAKGEEFLWGNLSAAQQALLNDDENLLKYVRGDRSKEQKQGGSYRDRIASVIGDIAHSSPYFVAEPENRFYDRFAWTELSSYRSFVFSHKNRTPMVYVGANDGMLHGFNGDTGEELFAYIPGESLPALKELAKPTYAHQYYVDGSPVVIDAFVNGAWRSILIGTTGRGGATVFAIDVTNPESLGANSVMWEYTSSDIGNMVAKPIVGRLNNGKWAVILGNGYNSSGDKAGLTILDIENGSLIKHINTGVGSSSSALSNGLGQPETWDADNDGNIDYVFAGDLQGNLWKFDLTANNVGNWDSAYKQGSTPKPLFTAVDAGGIRQSITGGVSLSIEPNTGKLWVFFGTGRYLSSSDPSNHQVQSWYGLIDGDPITSRASLASRQIIEETTVSGLVVRAVTENMTIAANQKGWYIDLIVDGNAVGERIVNQPKIIGRGLVVNSVVPDTDECNPTGDGYVMAIDPFTGSRLTKNFFDVNKDGEVNNSDQIAVDGEQVAVSGIGYNSMPGEPLFFNDEMVVGLSNTEIKKILTSTGVRRGRVSWREMNN